MDSSKIFGGHGAEECQSSESGWTMYIGSPVDGEVLEDDDDDDDGMKNNVVYDHDDVDDDDDDDDGDGSDDSMASDASSGPSQQPWDQSNNGETGYHHGHGGYGQVLAPKYDHDQDDKKYSCSNKKVRKQEKKKKKKETGVEGRKEECLFTDQKRGIVTIQSGNRASWYLGQRK